MVSDPDLWLKGSLGDRYEVDQKHIVNVHKSLANRPPSFNRLIHIKFLRYVGEQS